MRRFFFLIMFAVFALAAPVRAQEHAYAAQQELVGSRLLDLHFTDWLKNQPADTNFQGRFKVLEFWATWCRPCLAAVPHLNKLQREFADSNIVFLSVTYQTPEETKATLAKHNFETIVVSDRNRRLHNLLRISYNGTMGLPRTVILDKNNNILWYGNPKRLSARVIKEFLRRDP